MLYSSNLKKKFKYVCIYSIDENKYSDLFDKTVRPV